MRNPVGTRSCNDKWKKKTMQESLQEGKSRVFLCELKHFDFKVFYMQERGVQTEVQMPGIA